jgi:hypothetical protein
MSTEQELNETEASDTITMKPTVSRSELLAKMVAYASQLPIDTLAQKVEEVTATPDEVFASTQQAPVGDANQNKGTINSANAPGEMAPETMREDLAAIFGEADLTEDFKTKIEALFEAAVNTRVQLKVTQVEEQLIEKLDEYTGQQIEEMSNNIDDYLSYVAEQWVENNALQVESGLRTELAESLLSSIHQVFVEHNVSVPDDKVDLVEALQEEIEQLKEKVNVLVEDNVHKNKLLEQTEKKTIVEGIAGNLPLIQKQKLVQLAEGISYIDTNHFAKKVQFLKETHFGSSSKPVAKDQLLTEQAPPDNTNTEADQTKARLADPLMEARMKALSLSVKNQKL